jgi:hypothetical protein
MAKRGSGEELRGELDRIALEIDDGLLAFASPEARREWTALWSRRQAASVAVTIVDDDLVVDVQKVRRFSEILRALKADGRSDGDAASGKALLDSGEIPDAAGARRLS